MLSALMLLVAGGCKKDETTPQKTTYDMSVKDVLGVTGTITFTETSSTKTTIDIVLKNAPEGTHPANLDPVDANGKSSTIVTTMTYSQLIAYDGCIRVMKSALEPNVIVAQGDIGGNVLTTTNKSYTLTEIGVYGVSGTALFEKRVNGNTLVTISLTGTITGDSYPASINLGSTTSVGGGPVVKILNNVDGTTGKGFTNIKNLLDGTAVTYDNWLVYDGYINVYQATIGLNNIICQGNIGSN